MRKSMFLIFVPLLLCFAKCRKEKTPRPVLPPVTQEGKNTVGFTLDSEVWVPYYQCGIGRNPCGEISARYDAPMAATDAISFQFLRKRGSKLSSLTISSSGRGTVTSVGDKLDSISVNYTGENWTGNTDTYSGPLPGSKFIITKLDKENQIISGTFEFVLTEDNRSGKTITLKEGRFDFKFNACKCSN